MVSVRQARGLPVVSLLPHPASFRFRLTADTLAFGYLLPATRRIRVFHPLETCAAGRTYKIPWGKAAFPRGSYLGQKRSSVVPCLLLVGFRGAGGRRSPLLQIARIKFFVSGNPPPGRYPLWDRRPPRARWSGNRGSLLLPGRSGTYPTARRPCRRTTWTRKP